jgi:hypothetical protein
MVSHDGHHRDVGFEAAGQTTWCASQSRQELLVDETTKAPGMQDCLKLVAALLRGCEEWQPPVDELRALMDAAYADISTASAPLLAVLRAVLARKLLQVIEVYDVMKRVQARPYTASAATRAACIAQKGTCHV